MLNEGKITKLPPSLNLETPLRFFLLSLNPILFCHKVLIKLYEL